MMTHIRCREIIRQKFEEAMVEVMADRASGDADLLQELEIDRHIDGLTSVAMQIRLQNPAKETTDVSQP